MISIVFCGDIKYCPYIYRYIDRIERKGKKYSVYFWNRSGENIKLENNYHYFNEKSPLLSSKFQKLMDFNKFRKWLSEEIDFKNTEKFIILSTLSGFLLLRHLLNFRKKYIYDIRDYTYENILIFSKYEKLLIENSCFTAISSKEFQKFLPAWENYIIAHNFNRNEIFGEKKFTKAQGKINIVWNGTLRYFEYQKKYLELLKNDERFRVIFCGDGPEFEIYKKYCENPMISNIKVYGVYNINEKQKILENANILNNCYGNPKIENSKNKEIKYAISNRFYDGIINHIPQIVEPNTFKSYLVKKWKIGVSLFPTPDFADKLYNYYQNIDNKEFDENCNYILKRVEKEDDLYISAIDKFIDN